MTIYRRIIPRNSAVNGYWRGLLWNKKVVKVRWSGGEFLRVQYKHPEDIKYHGEIYSVYSNPNVTDRFKGGTVTKVRAVKRGGKWFWKIEIEKRKVKA